MNSHWQPVSVADAFQSGILVLQSDSHSIRSSRPTALREAFSEQGVALSAYESGFVRLSMPTEPFTSQDLARLETAIRSVA